MFDIGWSELLVIAVIAVVVVGPKDLPRMMRNIGRYVSKAKSMARDFQSQFDDMVRDTELDDVRKSIGDIASGSPGNMIKDAIEPFTSAADDLQKTVDKSETPATPTKPAGETASPKIAAKPGKSAPRKAKSTARKTAKSAAKKPAPAKPAGSAAPKTKKTAPRKSSTASAPHKSSAASAPRKSSAASAPRKSSAASAPGPKPRPKKTASPV